MSKKSYCSLVVLFLMIGIVAWQTGCQTSTQPAGNTNTNANDNGNDNGNGNDNSGSPLPGDDCPDDPNKTEPGVCGCGVPDVDTDGDLTYDCNDECPDDANKISAGECGCGNTDTDTDNDGTLDCNDDCPDDANKTEAGECGCGNADTDTDNDGTLDCNDECPDDADKTEAGECGCGETELDSDEDGTPDCNDECIYDDEKIDAGECGCGNDETDTDSDGKPDCVDNCPNDANKTEPGLCGCGIAESNCGAATLEVVKTSCFEPFISRTTFRIKDWQGNALYSGVNSSNFTVRENGLELNPLVSPVYVMEGDSLPLKVVVVMDYTLTMDTISGIDDVINAVKLFIDDSSFNENHMLGLVEFHDRDYDFNTFPEPYLPLTTQDAAGKTQAKAWIPDVDANPHGNSRLWDAAVDAVEMISNSGGDMEQEARAVILITTGYSDSSTKTASDLISDANAAGVSVYSIAIGSIQSADKAGLQKAATDTDGQYYAVGDPNDLDNLVTGDLETAFDLIVNNLLGQWVLNYITPQPEGSSASVDVDFNWGSYTTTVTLSDYCSLEGETGAGLIEIIEGEYDTNGTPGITNDDSKSFILKAFYLPRGITEFRFGLSHASFTWQTGSLLSSWGTIAADTGNGYLIGAGTDGTELPFGGYGIMGTLTIHGEGNISTPDIFDDSITLPPNTTIGFCDSYGGGQSVCPLETSTWP